ncbi:MAG TPA: hypothetical protein VGJ06_16870 [Candidatus Acidoferrum sp.]|jgi:hypothetical protein
MAQTIWLHRLNDSDKKQADGMEFVCVHLFQGLANASKLTKEKGWNPVPNATSKDGASHKAMCCDTCEKNYKDGSVRLAKGPVLV